MWFVGNQVIMGLACRMLCCLVVMGMCDGGCEFDLRRRVEIQLVWVLVVRLLMRAAWLLLAWVCWRRACG